MPASRILIYAALTMGLLLQGSPCFGDDHTKLSGTWKLVAFMTEDIDNKVRENVCDEQAEGYLTFTAAGRVFGLRMAAHRGAASLPFGRRQAARRNDLPPLSECVREQNDQHSGLGARIRKIKNN